LFVEVAGLAGGRAFDGEGVRGAVEDVGGVHAVEVERGEEGLEGLAERMRFEVELAGETVGQEGGGAGGRCCIRLKEADVELVVAGVDPAEGVAGVFMGDKDAKAVAAKGALDGAAPAGLRVFHLDEFSGEGEVGGGEAEVGGESGAEALEIAGEVGAGTGLDLAFFCLEASEFGLMRGDGDADLEGGVLGLLFLGFERGSEGGGFFEGGCEGGFGGGRRERKARADGGEIGCVAATAGELVAGFSDEGAEAVDIGAAALEVAGVAVFGVEAGLGGLGFGGVEAGLGFGEVGPEFGDAGLPEAAGVEGVAYGEDAFEASAEFKVGNAESDRGGAARRGEGALWSRARTSAA
jgi:hypothetical protein